MAAYNYGFPVTYQPMQNAYAQPQQQMSYAQPTPQPQPQTTGIIWVQGEAAAKAYPVAPGSNVLLMDSEGECFYIKSTDASGMPQPLRVFEYKEIAYTQPSLPQNNMSNASAPVDFNPDEYVKREELEALKQQLEQMPKQNNSRRALERKEKEDGK